MNMAENQSFLSKKSANIAQNRPFKAPDSPISYYFEAFLSQYDT